MEAELRGHAAAVGDGVLSLDENLRVREANARAAEILGYQTKELEGLPVQDVLVGPEDVRGTLLDALGHDLAAERSRLILHRRDGTPFPVRLRARPLGAGARTRLLVVLHDQSEQAAIESQTEILAQRALLGEVSAIFAHEVRNPINNISTGVQFMASRLGHDHPLYESLERVRKECIRLDQLMTDVLFFARPLELHMEPTDLADLMRRLLARWQPRLAQAGVLSHTSFAEAHSRRPDRSSHLRAGYRQPDHERRAGDVGRRYTLGEPVALGDTPRPPCGTACRRHGTGDSPRRDRSRLRSFLHHEEGRDGPRPGDFPPHPGRPQGHDHRRELPRRRHGFHRAASGG